MTSQIANVIERWISTRDKKQVRLNFKPIDQARLLKLELWSRRYSVDIEEILDLIMPILRAQVKRKPRRQGGLGVTPATLTGDAAERILSQELHKKYPDGEHRAVYRERQREQQLANEKNDDLEGLPAREPKLKGPLESSSVDEYVARYTDKVMEKRKQMQVEMGNPKRTCKRYRGNPWQ